MHTIKLLLQKISVFKLQNPTQMCILHVTSFILFSQAGSNNKLLHKSMQTLAGSFKAIDKNQSIHCKRPTFTISLIRMQKTNSMALDGKNT